MIEQHEIAKVGIEHVHGPIFQDADDVRDRAAKTCDALAGHIEKLLSEVEPNPSSVARLTKALAKLVEAVR